MSETPSAEPPSAGLAARLPRWLKLVARPALLLLVAVALGLCGLEIANNWPRVSHAITHATVALLVLALLAAVLAMSGLAALWWTVLRGFGRGVRPAQALAWFFSGELGKYIPGGVWTVLGRGEMARVHGGIDRPTGYATTLLCYAGMTLGAAVALGLLSPFVALDGGGTAWAWAAVLLIPAALAATSPSVLARLLRIGARVTRGRLEIGAPDWRETLMAVCVSIPAWLLVGVCSALVTAAFGYHQQLAQTVFAAIAAWIIGFLAVPVPAGSGIREVIFIALSGLGLADGTAVAIAARFLFICVDGVGGLSGLAYVRVGTAGASRGAVGEAP